MKYLHNLRLACVCAWWLPIGVCSTIFVFLLLRGFILIVFSEWPEDWLSALALALVRDGFTLAAAIFYSLLLAAVAGIPLVWVLITFGSDSFLAYLTFAVAFTVLAGVSTATLPGWVIHLSAMVGAAITWFGVQIHRQELRRIYAAERRVIS